MKLSWLALPLTVLVLVASLLHVGSPASAQSPTRPTMPCRLSWRPVRTSILNSRQGRSP